MGKNFQTWRSCCRKDRNTSFLIFLRPSTFKITSGMLQARIDTIEMLTKKMMMIMVSRAGVSNAKPHRLDNSLYTYLLFAYVLILSNKVEDMFMTCLYKRF